MDMICIASCMESTGRLNEDQKSHIMNSDSGFILNLPPFVGSPRSGESRAGELLGEQAIFGFLWIDQVPRQSSLIIFGLRFEFVPKSIQISDIVPSLVHLCNRKTSQCNLDWSD